MMLIICKAWVAAVLLALIGSIVYTGIVYPEARLVLTFLFVIPMTFAAVAYIGTHE